MSKVFVGGSRRLSRLNKEVRGRLDNIVKNRLTVLVGDANGADRAVQEYLASKGYDQVVVYCAGGECRNNLGKWPARHIGPRDKVRRDFAYYATKDRSMADETDYGLMLWDGKSRGTLTSIVDLMRRGKPVVVYFSPSRAFQTLSNREDLAVLSRWVEPDLLRRIERDLHATGEASLIGPHHRAGNMVLF